MFVCNSFNVSTNIGNRLVRKESPKNVRLYNSYMILESSVVCGIGERACGSSCYKPLTQNCYGSLVCTGSERPCGSYSCYNTLIQKCYGSFACTFLERPCGNRCYNPATQKCFA